MAENLRDWYQAPPVIKKKPPRYKSKYNPTAPPCYSTFTKNVPSEPEKKFEQKKLPIASILGDKSILAKRTTKNFIKENAVEAILSKAVKPAGPPRRYVDKEGYGRVPHYIKDHKEQIQFEKELLEQYIRESKQPEKLEENSNIISQSLPEGDRIELIRQLKRKWGLVHRHYQNIIGTDSKTKIKLKENYEQQLSNLENDIKLLSRGPIKIIED